jgi:outer membrane protein assembly factor BamB
MPPTATIPFLSSRRLNQADSATRLLRFAVVNVALGLVSASLTAADNWTHWRGPHANGTAPLADPPTTWDGPSGKNIRWRAELVGKGSATPIIWGDQVFIVSAEQTDRKAKPEEIPDPKDRVTPRKGYERQTTEPTDFFRFIVTSYHRGTGKEIWRKVVAELVPHEGHHATHSYAAGSPTTDGERLYVSFGSFGIFCFDLNGKPLWERQLGKLTTRRGYGEAVTPVLHQGRLLINWDQEWNSALFCLDAKTGETKWKADRVEDHDLDHAARDGVRRENPSDPQRHAQHPQSRL